MPHSYPSPSEKHVLRRLKHLVLNDDFPNEESIPEETNGSLDTGKKRGKYSCEKVSIIEETNGSLDMGKKRGNYSCKEVSRHSTARVPVIARSRGPPTRFLFSAIPWMNSVLTNLSTVPVCSMKKTLASFSKSSSTIHQCNVPLKGHVCPYRPVKRKPCYDRKKRQKIKTTDKNIQTTEEG
jgi:hypothetical protein